MSSPTPLGHTVKVCHMALTQLEYTMNQSHIAMGTGSHGYTGWREGGKLSNLLLFVSVCLCVCVSM